MPFTFTITSHSSAAVVALVTNTIDTNEGAGLVGVALKIVGEVEIPVSISLVPRNITAKGEPVCPPHAHLEITNFYLHSGFTDFLQVALTLWRQLWVQPFTLPPPALP